MAALPVRYGRSLGAELVAARILAQLGLPVVDRYVSIVFNKANEVFKSSAKLSHILLNALSVFFLRFRVTLQQLDQSAYVANLVVVLLDFQL